MATFQPLNYKIKLKNAQHFAFIQAFITALQAAGFAAAKLVAKLAELVAAFAVEDRYYMVVRASEIIAQRAAADEKRDRFYGRLHRLVMAWAGSGMAQLDPAATALNRIFKLYKVNVSAQMDEETGALENLITDLSTTEMQAHIATINGTYLFEQMVEGQNLVKSLRLSQGVEESEKVYGALSAARKECDRLYDEMCAIIEGASLFADDTTPYDTFISQWNGTVKLYQDMLDKKGGGSSSNGQNGQSGENNGSGSEQGGGSDNGGTTPQPDDDAGFGGGGGLPPSGGGEVGDDNGGSSENGGGDNGGGLPPSGGGEVGDNSGGGGGLPGSGGEG